MKKLPSAALVAAIILAAGCERSSAPPGTNTDKKSTKTGATKPLPRGLFDPRFGFACSPDPAARCRGVFSPHARSEVALLETGEDALRMRVHSLRQAKRSIRIQALIFSGDESGLLIAELLKQKKKQGLDVRVIVDAASNLNWQTQWMYFDLKKHGVEVEGYEALYLQWVTAELKLLDPLRPNKRFHDKLWIVDAEDPARAVAIVGGLNIANEYFRVDPKPINRWRDQDVALRGPLVRDVTAAFDRNYRFFKGLKRKLPPLQNPDNSWRLARASVAKIVRAKVPFWKDPALERALAAILQQAPKLRYETVRARFIQSRPRLKETFIEQAYLDLIRRAKKRVLIANAYFIPWRRLTRALKQAARRGVKIAVLTNSPATNDIGSVAVVSRYTFLDLLQVNAERAVKRAGGGIAIHEWQGAPHNEGTLHTKYALFDDDEAIVGSFNLDPRSARLNSETAVAVKHRGLVARLAQTFLKDKLPKSTRVTLAQARSYRKPANIKQRFKLLFTLPIKDWL
jgi:putative cardiolipin synthase